MAVAITRTSNIHLSNSGVRFTFANSDVVDLNKHISLHGVSKKRCSLRLEVRRHWSPFHKARRIVYFVPFASTDDGIAANGTPQASGNSGMEEMRTKLNQSLQGENISSGLVQSIHDAARAIQLAIMEHSSLSKAPWFSKAWLVVDKNAWVKTLSYQFIASMCSVGECNPRRVVYQATCSLRMVLVPPAYNGCDNLCKPF